MSSQLWQRFPLERGLRALDMKDRLQERIGKDVSGASPEELVAYFREASRRFRRGVRCNAPEPESLPSAVRDADRTPDGV